MSPLTGQKPFCCNVHALISGQRRGWFGFSEQLAAFCDDVRVLLATINVAFNLPLVFWRQKGKARPPLSTPCLSTTKYSSEISLVQRSLCFIRYFEMGFDGTTPWSVSSVRFALTSSGGLSDIARHNTRQI